MKKVSRLSCIFAALIVALLYSHTALSQTKTAYIKDTLYVPIRSGDSNQYRILHKGLKSGTKLNIIEENDDKTWVKVTTENGIEGWLPSQFISNTKTANLLVDSYKNDAEKARKELNELKTSYANTDAELKKESSTAEEYFNENTKLTLELQKIKSISSNAIAMDQNYQNLLEQHELLKTKYDTLFAENENLKADQRLSFLLYGAGLIILGMLLMIILPMLKPKQRFSEWK
jgi:SH3 domain protein